MPLADGTRFPDRGRSALRALRPGMAPRGRPVTLPAAVPAVFQTLPSLPPAAKVSRSRASAPRAVAVFLSLCLHLGPLVLLLEAVRGVMSSGDGGTGLQTIAAIPVMTVELVTEVPSPVNLLPDTPPWVPDTAPPLFPVPPVDADAAPTMLPAAPSDLIAVPRPAELGAVVETPAPDAPPPAMDRPDPPPPKETIRSRTERTTEAPPETAPAKVEPPDVPAKEAPPKRTTKPAPGGQAAETAAGSGGKAAVGSGGKAEEASPKKADRSDFLATWGAKIKARIDRKKVYPKGVKGVRGQATVALTVSRSGQLLSVSVSKSSGHPELDAAAVKAVLRVGRFPAAPKGLDEASYRFSLGIVFAG